jgi:hypothetical protein
MSSLRIGNGAGFLGDQPEAAARMLASDSVDVLTLEYLAELTLSILSHQRRQQPQLGYARDFLQVLRQIVPHLGPADRPRVVTNAGGVHVAACVHEAARVLVESGCGHLRLASIDGDDLTARIPDILAAGCPLAHLDTGRPLQDLPHPVVSAHAYLGARPLAEAWHERADLMITGRVADASLTVGPAMGHFGWSWEDWHRLAQASVAGHLIECGAQATGGYSLRWEDVDLVDVGYPIAELDETGHCWITKSAGSGGRVDRLSVIEQLLYEIGDPRHYHTPDVTVDISSAQVEPWGIDRVQVTGAEGRPPPDSYKVSLAYADGFMASAQLLIAGRDCVRKAERCAEIVFARLARLGWNYARQYHELLGTGRGLPGNVPLPDVDPPELILRLAVHDPRREAVEDFTRQLAPLVTSGPAGIAGYAVARSPVRPVFAFWPTQIPRDLVPPRLAVRTATRWAEKTP